MKYTALWHNPLPHSEQVELQSKDDDEPACIPEWQQFTSGDGGEFRKSVRAAQGCLRALSVFHSVSALCGAFCMGAQGA